MSNRTNYFRHEETYRHLKQSGQDGWGADTLARRMEGWNETLRELMKMPEFPKPGSPVLELGSGAGDSALPLAEAGYQVTGIEISPTAVAWAQEKFASRNLNARFVEANVAQEWPFADAQFNAVLDAACFHCIIGADREVFLKEAHRVLKPHGFLLISSMVGDPKRSSPEFTFDPQSRCQVMNGVAYRYMSTSEGLIDEIARQGFKIIGYEKAERPWWDHLVVFALRT